MIEKKIPIDMIIIVMILIPSQVDIRAPPSISSHSPASIEVEKGQVCNEFVKKQNKKIMLMMTLIIKIILTIPYFQDVTLSCKGTGSPRPAIKWTRDPEVGLEDGVDRKLWE